MRSFRPLSALGPVLLAMLIGLGPATAGESVLRLATTTSTDNSGVLRQLLEPFERETGIEVQVIAVGTGKALRLGQDGEVDIVLVHARPAEDRFIEAGYGVNRRDVMYNDFIVLGPPNDPAGIAGEKDVAAALAKIAAAEAGFISRGDDSGTHKKERALWVDAGIAPQGGWYREVGRGMGKTLQMAAELEAYTLADRGTWLSFRDKLPLHIVVEGDDRLANPYGVIAVNPARYPDLNYEGALRLIAWMTSPRGQRLIGGYRIGGQALFKPLAIPETRLGKLD